MSFAVGSERAGISIRQSATPEPARAGDTLRFAVDVRNSGDRDQDAIFDLGETWHYQSKRILGSCSGTLTNTATVSADALGLGSRVQDSARAIVQVLLPGESGYSGRR